jgi:hypothetical protein
MKFPLFPFLAIAAALSTAHGAMATLGQYKTDYTNFSGVTSVNQSAPYHVNLSDLTGLTVGAPIRIQYTPNAALIWIGDFKAWPETLTLVWTADMEISAGGATTTFTETWSDSLLIKGPDPTDAGGYSFGPAPVTRSVVVPWGTDLSNLSFTLRDRSSIFSGVYYGSHMSCTGATFVTSSVIEPEIQIEQPSGTPLANNAPVAFGATPPGQGKPLAFTLRNIGYAPLTLGDAAFSGANPGDFTITPPLAGSLPAGDRASFTVTFNPAATGSRTATFTLPSDDADEASTTLSFSGNGMSLTNDTDADGLNDVAEFNLSALGFDWQVSQPAKVATLFAGAAGAGLFTPAQLQGVPAETPLVFRNPANGKFKLTMDWKKSTDLAAYSGFPAQPAEVSVNPSGGIEFTFSNPDEKAFFKVEMK